ncbi:DNA/RNA nuclease SfsA [bacterium]|nr:DNA/RNA nuclease SfsA [candidate division CSSED10-310 bacterium]
MNFSQRLTEGILIRRYNRFLADVRLQDGAIVTAHCPNSGSMMTCSEPGMPVYLSRHQSKTRRYPHTWEIIDMHGTLVGINTMIPNRIVREAIEQERIPELAGYTQLRREVPYGANSRIDILLLDGDKRCYVEVKNVTLVVEDRCLFPDAVTTRGQKHLVELGLAASHGHRAVMLYVVQRSDGSSFAPAEAIDGDYARLLRSAAAAGVEILAYRADVTTEGICLGSAVPVFLDVQNKMGEAAC